MSKTIIITGSSRGIGRAIALKYASENFNIVINSLKGGEKLENTLADVKRLQSEAALKANEAPAGCLALQGDVALPETATAIVGEALKAFGSVDILVNNAGISVVGLIQDLSPEDWQRILNTNLSSVHYFSQAVIPDMVSRKNGKIINISSVWGNVGASCEAAYSATKGGINTYTKALAKELAPSGIAVNAIACGAVDTDMNKCFDLKDLQDLADEIPAGRLATPEEIADVVYNISLCPSYLTGQVITCDGGWT